MISNISPTAHDQNRRNSLSSLPSSSKLVNPLHLPAVALPDHLSPTSPRVMHSPPNSMFCIGASPLMPTTTATTMSYPTMLSANGTTSPVRVSGTEVVVASVSTNGNKMTVTELCNGHEYDHDGLLAAEALAGLKNGGMTGQPYSTSIHMAEPHMQQQHPQSPVLHQEHFMQRVTNIPIVNKSINQIGAVYEAGKNTSRIVRYSAETVETGVKSISGPILDKLEPALAPLDRFACNQLDKLERAVPSVFSPVPGGSPLIEPSTIQSLENDDSNRAYGQSHIVSMPQSPHLSRPDMMVSSPHCNSYAHPPVSPGCFQRNGSSSSSSRGDMMIDHKPRSAWQTALGGVSSMVLSDETMRALKYCLQWLQYATAHIERQIAILRGYLARAGNQVVGMLSGNQPTPPLSPSNELSVTIGNDFMAVVVGIKREIVDTLRKVVDVIGRYAAAYLPGDARTSVRGFILSLPTRWATLNGSDPSANNNNSNSACSEAQKVLTLAGESSNMLKSVMSIFAQTVDGAERLMGRVVGMGSYATVPSASPCASYAAMAALQPAANATTHEGGDRLNSTTSDYMEARGASNGANGHDHEMDVEMEDNEDEEHSKSMEVDS
ncbi:hypothetical protein SeMB42_g01276 [Synchytrium endobioticum]|uniref:Transcription factor Opi1 n=1 Tax=Synchytrium endobioticum TaxID=286115 RepID=A0A507DP49_9FUNG|nr:hypothetical protein SeLEV6574_g05963 [Synchytrium endobioticum]TPX52648.1 hypothetical protein SeMB42_g01276 [Synchytrium endobioticum]